MAKKKIKDECNIIRSPICTTLGHVDHGKSSILDAIRGSSIIDKEAGKITQAIGASIVPLETIKKICGSLLDNLHLEFSIPGLLFIDTPGHAAFTSLRKRGGNLADIAILVIDINEGFKPQTIEALEILKNSKTPFVVAANKLDLFPGFKDMKTDLQENLKMQAEEVQRKIDMRIYEILGKLSEYGIQSERFDRIEDYSKQVAIIPVSAKKSIGISQLLMTLAGLAQRYLEKGLSINTAGSAKGAILEVKEEKGLGKTIDVIIYDGNLNINDIIIIGSINEPIVTKVKALLEPAPLEEMRDLKTKFRSVRCVAAATGVKISAPGLDNAISGMPLRSCAPKEIDKVKEEIQKEVKEVFIDTESTGIIIKADSLGSLEAMIKILQEKDIPIRKATIGNISKKDIAEAEASLESDPLLGVILGFNITDRSEAKSEVKIIISDIIYHILDRFEAWQEEKLKEQEKKELENLKKPFKIRIMEGYVFRQSNPAVVGVEVESGILFSNTLVMNKEGREISIVKGIQHEQKNIEKAEKGKQVAVSLENVTVGRQIHEGDVLYSALNEKEFRKYKEFKKLLSNEDRELLKEIVDVKRKENPVWGI